MKTGLLIGLGLAIAALAGGSAFGMGDKPTPPGGGGGGTVPPGGGNTPPGGGNTPPGGGGGSKPGTLPKPGKGRTFGTGTPPASWNPATNQFWISPDCTLILEGEDFEPASRGAKTIEAQEAPTLAGTLAIGPKNSVYGYIDYLMGQGDTDAGIIAIKIMREANAECANGFPATTPQALADWYQSFRNRISPWVNLATIGFSPDGGG